LGSRAQTKVCARNLKKRESVDFVVAKMYCISILTRNTFAQSRFQAEVCLNHC
jgi:hypothetical protein